MCKRTCVFVFVHVCLSVYEFIVHMCLLVSAYVRVCIFLFAHVCVSICVYMGVNIRVVHPKVCLSMYA